MLTFNVSLRMGAAAILLAAAAPAFAAEPSRAPSDSVATDTGGAPAPAPAAEAKPAKEERRICRFDSATGSNVRGKKICLTARQWRARQD